MAAIQNREADSVSAVRVTQQTVVLATLTVISKLLFDRHNLLEAGWMMPPPD